MNKIFFFCLLFCLPGLLAAQDSLALSIYPFAGRYVQLDQLRPYESENIAAQSFKTESKYHSRFDGLSIDKIAFKGQLFELTARQGVLMTDLSSKAATPLLNREEKALSGGQNFLLLAQDGAVCVKHLKGAEGYKVYKYNAAGEEVFGLQIPHSDSVSYAELRYSRPYLNYFSHSSKQLVFNSYLESKQKSVVLDLEKGQLSEYDFSFDGLIWDEATDSEIRGFLQILPDNQQLQILYKQQSFALPIEQIQRYEEIKTLLIDNTLYAIVFNERAPGALLLAISLSEEKLLWRQLLEPKSQRPKVGQAFYNYFWLSAYKDKLLIEQLSPNQKRLSIHNVEDGQRLEQFIH